MWSEYIEVRNGGYYVKGTRISLDSVIYAFRLGESPEAIRQNFPSLKLEQVYGAIIYYLANKDAVDAYLLETEKEWEQFADEHPIPIALREKLERARRESLVKRS
jgi:uncharacterized protein (DUF433 family)